MVVVSSMLTGCASDNDVDATIKQEFLTEPVTLDATLQPDEVDSLKGFSQQVTLPRARFVAPPGKVVPGDQIVVRCAEAGCVPIRGLVLEVAKDGLQVQFPADAWTEIPASSKLVFVRNAGPSR